MCPTRTGAWDRRQSWQNREDPGAVCLAGRVGVPVAHPWRAGQEGALGRLLPVFLPTWRHPVPLSLEVIVKAGTEAAARGV